MKTALHASVGDCESLLPPIFGEQGKSNKCTCRTNNNARKSRRKNAHTTPFQTGTHRVNLAGKNRKNLDCPKLEISFKNYGY